MGWREAHRRRVEELEAEAAAVILQELGVVLDAAAARLGQVITAAAEGEAVSSVDDLASIAAQWRAAVDAVLLPYFGGVFEAGAIAATEQVQALGMVVPEPDRDFLDHAAAQYLSKVTDRFYLLGDEAWEAARAQLLEGFAAGEGIDTLRRRVQEVTGLTAARAEALARTEVIGASNMGADARVTAMGADAPPYKQWLSTMDSRTRPTHMRADGQVVLFNQRFEVGGSYLRVPGDPSGPAGEVINCRCTTLYLDTDQPLDLEGRQEGGMEPTVDAVAGLTAADGPPQVDTHTGEPHTGAMLALVPEDPEAWTLAADGAEPAAQLHVTLAFLGKEADIPPEAQQLLQLHAEKVASTMGPVDANAFGANLWNSTGDEPSLNLAIGGPGLAALHDRVWGEVVGSATEATGWVPPVNHAPWVAHVCVAYLQPDTDVQTVLEAALALEGPIRFDRLRLALGGESFDFALAGSTPDQPAAGSMSPDPAILAGNSVNLVTAAQEGNTMPWEIRPGGDDCPFEVVKEGTDERAGCHDTEDSAKAQLAALYANEDDGDAAAAPEPMPGEHLRARMHTQGSATGLRNTGRMFTNTTYRDTPFAFHWSKASSAHGGQPHVVHIGNVVRVVPGAAPGQPDYGFVQLDLGSDDGREYARRSVAGFERWGSIGLDETKPTVTMEWPESDDDGDPLGALFDQPDLVQVDGGHVGELTGVSVPAQADAEIEPTPELIAAMLDAEPKRTVEDPPVPEPAAAAAEPARPAEAPTGADVADAVQALTAAAYTITIPELPPRWWYSEPVDVDMDAGAFNITEDGRVYAIVAPAGTNHRAFAKAGRRQEAPMGRVDYARFMGGWALTAGGKVAAGPITMDCGHASRFRADHDVAPAHYENSCTVVAKVAVGENRERGYIWAAGALEPGVTIDQVSRMLACRLSGDWQPHADKPGWTEFVAALLVPSPGFPMAHGGASATWEGDALVASSVPVRAVAKSGRPRLRIDRAAGTVRRLGPPTPKEQFAAVVAAVRSGTPLPAGAAKTRKGCC